MTMRAAIPATSYHYDAAGDYWFAPALKEFAQARNDACVSPCLAHAVVRVTGADAESFLHGQFITNLKKLTLRRGSLSAWCTPQGRVSFLFHLVPEPQGYLLLIPAAEAARLVQRLRMFVLRAKVTVEDVSGQIGVIGLSTPRASTQPAWSAGLQARRNAISVLGEGLQALCIDESARFLVWGELSALVPWWQHCSLPSIGSAGWRLLDIAQGFAEITGNAANAFLPQQLNLDMIEDALAFDKGCYPGQEIVARLKYRGEVKSRLLHGRANCALARDTRLKLRGAAHSAGQILSAVTLSSAETHFLAVVDLSALQDPPQVEDAPSVELQFERPPYWLI
jgi:tRNA-modifying protein YgfZ